MTTSRDNIEGTLTAPYFHRRWDNNDIDELKDSGFNGVVFCLREEHVGGSQSASDMNSVVSHAKSLGMETEIDLWGFGGVFGGEADSQFNASNPACYHRSEFRKLLSDGVKLSASLKPDGMFWDEAHFKDCRSCENNSELQLLTDYAQIAHESYGLRNAVCLTSNQANMGKLAALAALPQIHQIETDPYYSNYPGEHDAPDIYVAGYSQQVRSIATEHGKQSRIWVQGFELQSGWEDIPERAATAAINQGIRKIGFWACHNWSSANIDHGYPGIVPANNAAVMAQSHKISLQLH